MRGWDRREFAASDQGQVPRPAQWSITRGMDHALPPEIAAWFAGRGWALRRHQADMLAAAGRGQHALLVADTGAG